MAPYTNITPAQVKAKLAAGESFLLLDVRETDEYAIAHIEGSTLKPLSKAQEWANSLPHDTQIVVMCHHGGRSAQVAQALVQQLGHTNVANMVGGIESWSLTVDPTVRRY